MKYTYFYHSFAPRELKLVFGLAVIGKSVHCSLYERGIIYQVPTYAYFVVIKLSRICLLFVTLISFSHVAVCSCYRASMKVYGNIFERSKCCANRYKNITVLYHSVRVTLSIPSAFTITHKVRLIVYRYT